MIFSHSHKTTFRIPFNSKIASYKACKKLNSTLQLKIRNEHDQELISLPPIDLNELKNGVKSKIRASAQNFSSDKTQASLLDFIPSESHLSFYHTSDQSLEIQNFSPVFRTIVHDTITRTLRFVNQGDEPFTIHSIDINHEFFSCTKSIFPFTLKAGGCQDVVLPYAPSQECTFNCTLVMKTSILNHSTIEYQLTGVARYSQSYYKTINGVRYDRELLDQAKDLVYRSPAKQLSLDDVQHLVLYATDAHLFTPVEKRTLNYISNTFNCNNEAKHWLNNDDYVNLSRISSRTISRYQLNFKDLTGNPYALALKEIATNEFGFNNLEVSVLEYEAQKQSYNTRNVVSLEDAFRKALQSFLTDGKDCESPRSLIIEREQEGSRNSFPDEESFLKMIDERLRYHLNRGIIQLSYEKHDLDVAGSGSPEHGESCELNWGFYLDLPSYTGHLHWAIVDRTSGRTYNYGFN
ncbi:MAG: hypothetical protein QNK23_13775 [Crocinitomicaceae bacterium]|nr:hypothetical protein [Crocinitomicaceae bacterium]